MLPALDQFFLFAHCLALLSTDFCFHKPDLTQKKKLQHRRCLRYLFLAKYLGDSCTSFLGMSDITTYLDTPRTQPALHTPQNQGHLPQRLEEMRIKEDEPHDRFCKCSKVQQCVFYDRGSASLSMIFASTIHVPALHRPVSFYKPEDGATSSLSSTRLARCTYLEEMGTDGLHQKHQMNQVQKPWKFAKYAYLY
jgi:hypothetical protein